MYWFFTDKNGKPAIIQWPNLPLLVWLGALILARLTGGSAAGVFSVIATAALIVWAALEILYGQSPFRRLLGAVVLAFAVVNKFV